VTNWLEDFSDIVTGANYGFFVVAQIEQLRISVLGCAPMA